MNRFPSHCIFSALGSWYCTVFRSYQTRSLFPSDFINGFLCREYLFPMMKKHGKLMLGLK